MSFIKDHSIGKIAALLLVVSLLLPVSLKFAHAFEGHKHEVCTSKNTKHIHQIDHDCEFHKFKHNNLLTFVTQNYSIAEISSPRTEIPAYYQFLSTYQKLHFKLRGPPQLI